MIVNFVGKRISIYLQRLSFQNTEQLLIHIKHSTVSKAGGHTGPPEKLAEFSKEGRVAE